MQDWLTHRANATPGAEALVAADSGTTWTYEELDAAADEVATRLSGVGVTAGDHVGACLTPRPEYVTLVHAAMRLGARLVPLGHRLTAAELRPRLARSDVGVVVVASETEQRVVEATSDDGPGVPITSLDEPVWEQVRQLQTVEPAEFERAGWTQGTPLVYLFTSGSTGTPKLVTLTVSNVLASAVALAFRLGVDPGERTLATLAFHHTGGLMPLYRATLAGTTIILRGSFEPGATADDVRRHDATKVSLVPTMLKQMLNARGTLADSLRVVLLGGAPAPESLIERCRDYSIPVYPTYGMTEAASGITVATPDEAFDRPATVGQPLLGTSVSVRDETGAELAPGEVGEFVVSGPSITPGYYDDPAATTDAFGPHGLRTGDIGYIEDGLAYVLNRKDDRIVSGGENVDPGEVVSVVRTHPHVVDAAVVGVPDEEWGQRVAALVARSDETLDADDLRAFCRDRLAGFKLPRTVEFTDSLPRTDSGSVKRPAVRQRLVANLDGVVEADTPNDSTPVSGQTSRNRSSDGQNTGSDGDSQSGEKAGEPGERAGQSGERAGQSGERAGQSGERAGESGERAGQSGGSDGQTSPSGGQADESGDTPEAGEG